MPYGTKAAKAEYDRKRRAEKREELAARHKRYYAENRERLLANAKRYTAANPEINRAARKRYRDRHPERRAANRKKWGAANPHKVTAHNRARSFARRKARPDSDGRAYIAILSGDPCSYCGESHEHIDHIDPLSLGGNSAWDNLTSACERCNHSKRAKPLLVFMGSY